MYMRASRMMELDKIKQLVESIGIKSSNFM